MRRKSLILLFCWLAVFQFRADAALAFVNVSTPAEPGAASATTLASGSLNVTTGNMVILCGGSSTNAATNISSIADNASNTYTRVDGTNSAAVGGLEIWVAKNVTGNAALVATITYTGSQQFRFNTIAQYSGADTTSPTDVHNVGTGNNTAPLTAAATTTVADTVLVGCHAADNIADITAGTSFTRRTALNGDVSVEDRIVSATGSYTASESLSGTVNWLIVFGAFKQAGAATPALLKRRPVTLP